MRDCGFLVVYQLIFPTESLRNWQYKKYEKIREKEQEEEMEKELEELKMRHEVMMMQENPDPNHYP